MFLWFAPSQRSRRILNEARLRSLVLGVLYYLITGVRVFVIHAYRRVQEFNIGIGWGYPAPDFIICPSPVTKNAKAEGLTSFIELLCEESRGVRLDFFIFADLMLASTTSSSPHLLSDVAFCLCYLPGASPPQSHLGITNAYQTSPKGGRRLGDACDNYAARTWALDGQQTAADFKDHPSTKPSTKEWQRRADTS